jgi:hypothetical protein
MTHRRMLYVGPGVSIEDNGLKYIDLGLMEKKLTDFCRKAKANHKQIFAKTGRTRKPLRARRTPFP